MNKKMYGHIYCPQIWIDIITKNEEGEAVKDKREEMFGLLLDLTEKLIHPYSNEVNIEVRWESGVWKEYRYSQKALEKIKNRIISECFIVIIFEEYPKQPFYASEKERPLDFVLMPVKNNFRIVIDTEFWPGKKSESCYDRISVQQSLDFFGGSINMDEQQRWATLLKQLYITYQGFDGNLCINGASDRSFIETEWETFTGKLTNIDYQLRGIYWGNILNSGQIEQLGGIEEIKKSGLFYSIEELENKNGKHYYLQLTESLDECTIDDLKKLHRFLKEKNALLPIYPKYFEMKKDNDRKHKFGYSIQLIEDEVIKHEIK